MVVIPGYVIILLHMLGQPLLSNEIPAVRFSPLEKRTAGITWYYQGQHVLSQHMHHIVLSRDIQSHFVLSRDIPPQFVVSRDIQPHFVLSRDIPSKFVLSRDIPGYPEYKCHPTGYPSFRQDIDGYASFGRDIPGYPVADGERPVQAPPRRRRRPSRLHPCLQLY